MALIIAKAPTCGDPHAAYLTSPLQTCYISTSFVLFESLCFGVLRFIFQIATDFTKGISYVPLHSSAGGR